MDKKAAKESKITIVVTKARNRPVFIGTKSEPIMVVKRGEKEIHVRINDTVKIGPGIYRIVEYVPFKEWKNEFTGVGFNASVKCMLLKGHLFYDLKRVAYRDKKTGETFIELTPETLSYFVISAEEKNEIIQKKREALAAKLQEYQKRKENSQNKEQKDNSQ